MEAVDGPEVNVGEQAERSEGKRAEIETGLLRKDPRVLVNTARAMVEDRKIKEIVQYKEIARERVDPEGRRRHPEEPSLSMPEEERVIYEKSVSFVANGLGKLYPDIFKMKGSDLDIGDHVSRLKRGLGVLNVLTNFAEKGSGKVPENWRPSADMVRAIEGEEGNK